MGVLKNLKHRGDRVTQRRDYCFNCVSIAAITSFESGVTAGSKR
jgi:hypothetical protein